jgi:hypothetical protein
MASRPFRTKVGTDVPEADSIKTKPGPEKKKYAKTAVRINWSAPGYWQQISNTVKEMKTTSAIQIVRELRRRNRGLFRHLSDKTLGRWIDRVKTDARGKVIWKAKVLTRVSRGYQQKTYDGPVGILVRVLARLFSLA